MQNTLNTQNKGFFIDNPNVSRLIVPFYLDYKYENKNHALFGTEEWKRINKYSIYLTMCIQEIYKKEEDAICKFYKLDQSQWETFNLPPDRTVTIHMKSTTLSDRPCQHSFRLIDITTAYFTTGIGFLFFDIRHEDNAHLEEIVDTSFSLSNIFSSEHDHSGRECKLFFSYVDETSKETKSFSMKNAIYSILKAEQFGKEILDIFPTSRRKKINEYHRLYFKRQHTEADDRLIKLLASGLHSDALSRGTNTDLFESNFHFSAKENTIWNISSNGVVSVSYDKEGNNFFLANKHSRNIDVDYFLVYLFAAHEREILLKYNYDAVKIKNWRNTKQLVFMKDKLMEFNLWFLYNTVSVEGAYQDFYECLYRAFNLESLQNDIRDVIDKVDEHVNVLKERRTNTILSSIALLAIFSVLVDGLSFIDRIYSSTPFQSGHYAIIILIMIVVFYGLFYFFRGRK